MGHSRIFQVSSEPISKEEYIGSYSYDYDHWFIVDIADYVSDECDRSEDIEKLKHHIRGGQFGADDDGEYFIVISKEQYFEGKFEYFKNALDRLKECTLKDFVEGCPNIYLLQSLYNDKFHYYIEYDGDMMTIDTFIRCCTLNKKYYIGGTVDYHY